MGGQLDHWRELCIAAAFEDNPEKLKELIGEINKSLRERQEQLADQIFEKLAREPLPSPDRKRWVH